MIITELFRTRAGPLDNQAAQRTASALARERVPEHGA